MTTYPREAWGWSPGRGTLSAMPDDTDGLAVHWPGHRPGSGPILDVPMALRAYQRTHVQANGWSAIAYQEAVDQLGNRWVLRGLDTMSAANGSRDVNRTHGAVLALLVPGEVPSEAMLQGLRAVVADYRKRYPKALEVVTHGAIRPGGSECPGPILSALVKEGRLEPGRPPAKAPSKAPAKAPAKVPAFPGVMRRGSKGKGVGAVQSRLRARGWRVVVDQAFGPDTEGVVRAFQEDKDLEVDGVVGPKTWTALWKAPIT